ncbi:MAG: RNA polymerase sigma factor [Bacteroidaceae bacterium]|nr:RNA polymerase sigma factor [Bacteroidaceae bacterium]
MIFRLPTSLKRCSDGELMQRVSRDDSRAFEELYHRYARRLLHFFRRMLGGDKETAADFLQDTFLRVWSARRTFRGYDAETWIFTLAYNLCRNEFRHREVHDAYVWQASGEDEAADSLAELRIDAATFDTALSSLLSALPPEPRLLFALRYEEDLPTKQVADILGIPPATVRSRCHRLLSELRKKLCQYENL